MRSIDSSLANNVSSNNPIGDQFQHGSFIPKFMSLVKNSIETNQEVCLTKAVDASFSEILPLHDLI